MKTSFGENTSKRDAHSMKFYFYINQMSWLKTYIPIAIEANRNTIKGIFSKTLSYINAP